MEKIINTMLMLIVISSTYVAATSMVKLNGAIQLEKVLAQKSTLLARK